MIWDDVRDRLNQGWVKGYRHTSDGKVCLLGAFENTNLNAEAYNAEAYYPKELAMLVKVIKEDPVFCRRLCVPDSFNGEINWSDDTSVIAGFNNHFDTTLEDVLEVVSLAEAQSPVRLVRTVVCSLGKLHLPQEEKKEEEQPVTESVAV